MFAILFRSFLSNAPFCVGATQRAAAVALLLALASIEPALAADSDGGLSWWTLLGLPGFLNW